MNDLIRVMTAIMLDIWVLQLIYYFVQGANRNYEESLYRSKVEEEIKEIAGKVIDNVNKMNGDILE